MIDNNELDRIALNILNLVLKEAQDIWKNPNSKYKDYRSLQIDKRGSFGERFFEQTLSLIYYRRLKVEYKDGDQGDWDLKFNGMKFEIKTSSLDVNHKFQNEGLKKDGDYDAILFLGVAPNDLYVKFIRKKDIDFENEIVHSYTGITHLHNRGKDNSTKNATGAGYKCDFKIKEMIKVKTLNEIKIEFEKIFGNISKK